MIVIGYTGSGRNEEHDTKRKVFLLNHLKENKTYYDSFMGFSRDEEDIPINYFPLKGLGHDCSATLLRNGEIVASAAEERFNRHKHSISLDGRIIMPRQAFSFCLQEAGATIKDIDYVCYYLDMTPSVFEKKLEILKQFLPKTIAERVVASNRYSYEREFSKERVYDQLDRFTCYSWPREKVRFVPHHLAHAASAFYSSGFAESGILTLDGYGEKDSSVFALGSGEKIRLKEETSIPTSLGILYMVLTVYLGFKALNDEYKVMGLASYGNPKKYAREFGSLIRQCGESYDTCSLVGENFKEHLVELFGKPREEHEEVTRREMDIAASLQHALEQCVLERLWQLKQTYGIENICLSGGVALNCTLNGRIAESRLFKNMFVFPAATDDGCSIGAAQYVYHNELKQKRELRRFPSIYLGPSYGEKAIKVALDKYKTKVRYEKTGNIEAAVAALLLDQKVVGWFQGRMEFGPRALGNRSILGDARNSGMQELINVKVKLRETFRPFAPAVKHENMHDYFILEGIDESPFMLFTVPVREEMKRVIPSVTHVDGTARIQTVTRSDNERFWRLLDSFGHLTGVPILLNTSFNVKGEPIVCSPEDAIKCFLHTNIDALAIGDFLVEKI